MERFSFCHLGRPPGSKCWILTSGKGGTGLGSRYTEVASFVPVEAIVDHVESVCASKEGASVVTSDSSNATFVYCWGRYNWTRFATLMPLPILPPGTRVVQHIHTSFNEAILLLDDGSTFVKGSFYTATGRQNFDNWTANPCPHPSWKKVLLGTQNVMALDYHNRLWEWGLVSGTKDIPRNFLHLAKIQNIPTLVEGLEKEEIIDFAVGSSHFLAVDSSGRLYSWGVSDKRLGRNDPNYARDMTPQQRFERDTKIPTIVPFPDGVHIARVDARDGANVALDRAGRLWTWGWYVNALLGPDAPDCGAPTLLPSPEGVIFRDMAICQEPYVMAISTEGDVYACGKQEQSQCGVGHKNHIPTLTKVPLAEKAAAIAVSSGSSFILTVPTMKKFGILKAFIGDADDIYSAESAAAAAAEAAVSTPSSSSSDPYTNNYPATTTTPLAPHVATGYSINAAPTDSQAPTTPRSMAAATNYSELTSYFANSMYGKPVPASSVQLAVVNEDTGEEDLPMEYGMDLGASSLYGTISDLGDVPEASYKQITELESAQGPPSVVSYASTPTLPPSQSAPNLQLPQIKIEDIPRNGRDWNTEFQLLLSLSAETSEQQIDRDRGILLFYEEFVGQVKRIASTIISEVSVPPHLKTIRPLQVGGVAGGEKYIHDNIFLKFAIDMHGIYGGDEWSRKAASLELLGQDAYLACQTQIPDLRTPVMALIDFKGFRILATCVLPLAKGTSLVYGSDDGGRTCHYDDAYVAEIMAKCGELLNLKEHVVTDKRVKIFAPCDIEVHKGKDGNIYVIDTARIFPPEYPFPLFGAIKIPSYETDGQIVKLELDKGQLDILVKDLFCAKTQEGLLYYTNKGSINKTASAIVGYEVLGEAYLLYGIEGRILYYQLRPEFVRSYSRPLSSDAVRP